MIGGTSVPIALDVASVEEIVRDVHVGKALRHRGLPPSPMSSVGGPIVVMGVSGTGKSTAGASLAAALGSRFVDGDELHPAANVAKMASGVALDDSDRWPWLAAIRQSLRREPATVVACSALRRSYREALRGADGVRFVYLVAGRDDVTQRIAARSGHFMRERMVESQFEALERPDADETDVLHVDATRGPDDVLAAIQDGLGTLRAGTAVAPLLADGGVNRAITLTELATHVRELARSAILETGARRVLLVPPDHTRVRSRAGEITALLYGELVAEGCEIGVIPALGTHRAMRPADADLLFDGGIPFERILEHRWREGLIRLGEIAGTEVAALSDGRFTEPIPIEVDPELVAGWDLVVSVGQVVPHEVVGMANYTKNLVIGLGGGATVHRSHFLGAVCGMESIMGRASTPVRDVIDAGFDRFIAPRVPVIFILTVLADTAGGVVQRGLFAGRGGSAGSGGAAYRAAATLAATCNVEVVPQALDRVACWLDPAGFTSTWLANKAVYRTRMAIADGGELIVLAPGVERFGEDAAIDALIRRHGYHGRTAALAAIAEDSGLAENLGAAAHLIHGSSEGRFRIVYCTDPDGGGLSRDEVEGVGYEWRPLADELARLAVSGLTPSGPRRDRDGNTFAHIAVPALGLWAAATRYP